MKWMLNIGENKSKGLPKPKGERVTSWHFLFKRKVFLGEIISNHNEYTINRLFGQFTLPVKWSEFFYIRENRSKGLPESNGGSVTFWMFLLKRKSFFFFFFWWGCLWICVGLLSVRRGVSVIVDFPARIFLCFFSKLE